MAATTSTIDPTTEKKNLIDSACTTGKNFIDLFYDKMDTKRHNMAKSYLDTATLSWNGNRVDGPEEIQKFLLEKVPISSHQIHSFDAQPVWDEFVGGQRTVLVHVGGSVKYGGERPKPFQQNFLLTAYGDFWKVATDVFRYQELK